MTKSDGRGAEVVATLQDAVRSFQMVREEIEDLAREQGARVVAEALGAGRANG